MNTDFFIDLLVQVKEFENSDAYKCNAGVDDFRMWMNDKKYATESPTKLFQNENHKVSFTENEICKQVLLLGRYSKQLIRKGLGNFPELANEEFTYLYRLKDEPFLTKIQLIEKNDAEDKRSKRLNLTEQGKKIFHESVENVNQTSKILSGKLDDEEKNEFLRMMKKLNEFHAHVYSDYKNADIKKIGDLI